MHPSNFPNEVLLSILSALDRDEIEKCQLVWKRWNHLVNICIDSLPYRKLNLLKIGSVVEGPSDIFFAEVVGNEG